MTQTEHRLGVSEVNLVIRHLKLREANADAVTRAMGEIDNIHGMDHVSFEHESQVLNIAYDATITQLMSHLAAIRSHRISSNLCLLTWCKDL